MTSETNYDRIGQILLAFGPGNEGRRSAALIAELGMARATGFNLVKAMVDQGLLERLDHGIVRLGARARAFAFTPIEPRRLLDDNTRFLSATLPATRQLTENRPLSGAWNEMLTQPVHTEMFRRRPPYRLAFLTASMGNPWRKALSRSVEYGIRLHGDTISGFNHRSAEDDPKRQREQLTRLEDMELDGLIISVADAADVELSRQLEALLRRGLPVVAVDRRPRAFESFVSFVTASDGYIGETSALWLAQHLKGAGKIWALPGTDRASPAMRRLGAALKTFSQFPGIEVEAISYTGWTESGGYKAMRELLRQFDCSPDGVWCDSGLQGVGSLKAFLEDGQQPPAHTGGDLNQMYQIALERKVPFVAIDYPAAMGARAVDCLIDILSGRPVMKRIEMPVQTIMPRGFETASVKADEWAEKHVRWDLPGDVVLSQGLSLHTISRLKDKAPSKARSSR